MLITGYLVVEVVDGLISGSLALLADAGHMLTDSAAIGLALLAIWIPRARLQSSRHLISTVLRF